MGVAGGDDGLVQVLAQFDDSAVEVLDCVDGLHLAVSDHELVVAKRLDFEIVVIVSNAQQLLVGLAGHDGAVQLASFAGGRKQ